MSAAFTLSSRGGARIEQRRELVDAEDGAQEITLSTEKRERINL